MNKFEQGLLKYLSKEQLKSLQSKKIGIGGAGGLGSNLAVILARSGFNNFEILDGDLIDESNLNRQYYFVKDIGLPKVDALKNLLLEINPDIKVSIHNTKWSKESAGNYFKNCDFIAEAFDQAQFKRDFVEFYQDKAKIIVSGNGMAGFSSIKNLNIKEVKNIYFVGDAESDTACGLPPMAPRVTACSAMMAEVILNLSLFYQLKYQPSSLTTTSK